MEFAQRLQKEISSSARTKQHQKNLWVGYDATWRMGSGWMEVVVFMTMVIVVVGHLRDQVVGTPWGDPNYLVTGMILQVLPPAQIGGLLRDACFQTRSDFGWL